MKRFQPVKLKKASRTRGAKVLCANAHTEVIIYPWGKKRRWKGRNKAPGIYLTRALPGGKKSRGHLILRSFGLAGFHFRETLADTVKINSCLNSYRGVLQQGPLCEQSGSCVMGGPNNADGVLEPMWISQALPSGPEAGRSGASRNKRPAAAATWCSDEARQGKEGRMRTVGNEATACQPPHNHSGGGAPQGPRCLPQGTTCLRLPARLFLS